jgi:5-formyltetrahydrofolate cyclo-ligase
MKKKTMLKKEIRKVFKEMRMTMQPSEKLKSDDLILIRFQTVELPFLSNVLSFYSIDEKNEVNSFILTDYLHFRNPSIDIAYPRMKQDDTEMEAVVCTPDTAFELNEYGITEPAGDDILAAGDIELVLVPLLAFDKSGNRVGYGKGYYDRFLKHCDPGCLKIGLSYFEPVERIEDAGDFDVPLDLCITPREVYVF